MKIQYLFLLMILTMSFLCKQEKVKAKDDVEKINLTKDVTNLSSSDLSLMYNDSIIGRIIDNEKVITVDVNALKASWSKKISDNSPLTISISSIEFMETEDGLFLLGLSPNQKAKSITPLTVKGGVIYRAYVNDKELTVTCSGCESTGSSSAKDCIPQGTPREGYYCSKCSKGKCTKTVIVTERI